jgi:hypothetical protein
MNSAIVDISPQRSIAADVEFILIACNNDKGYSF